VRESIPEEDLFPEINIDAVIKFSEITPKFLRILDQFSPYGPGNMRPVFLCENVKVINSPRIVGTNHLLATLKQEGCEKVFDCIGFNMGEWYEDIKKNSSVLDVVFSIDRTFRDGRFFPQLKFKELVDVWSFKMGNN
jgi:single-stranded-DNA-specific exonuclease